MIVSQRQTGHFTIVPNKILQESNLSLQAMGLCAYILSLPKTWHINMNNLSQKLGVSKNTLYKYIKELIHAGVLKKAQLKDESGKWSKEGVYFIGDFSESRMQNDLDSEISMLETSESTQTKPLAVSQNLVIGKAAKNELEVSKVGKLAVSQNLTTIKKEYINKQKEKNAHENKKVSKTYILQSIDQKRLFSLCFAREVKACDIDLHLLTQEEQEAFNRFISYRQERARVSNSTKLAIFREFLRLKNVGQNLALCVEQSIMRGYRGLFLVAQNSPNNAQNVSNAHTSKAAQSKEILRDILTQYPEFDFSDIQGFLATHKINDRVVKYNNGVYCYA